MKPYGLGTLLRGIGERQQTVELSDLSGTERYRYHASSERRQFALAQVPVDCEWTSAYRYIAELHTREADVSRRHWQR